MSSAVKERVLCVSAVSRPHQKAESCSSSSREEKEGEKRGFSSFVKLVPWVEFHTLGANNQGLRFLSLETCGQLVRPNSC